MEWAQSAFLGGIHKQSEIILVRKSARACQHTFSMSYSIESTRVEIGKGVGSGIWEWLWTMDMKDEETDIIINTIHIL